MKPIDKDLVKEVLDIKSVVEKYSSGKSTQGDTFKIICPFHKDTNLGSCVVFTKTRSFCCYSCHTGGDALKLAGGYLGISNLNELLERIVRDFSMDRNQYVKDNTNYFVPGEKKKDLLTNQEYEILIGQDCYYIPKAMSSIEIQNGISAYEVTEYQKSYMRNLALQNSNLHDQLVCQISRQLWLNSFQFVQLCRAEKLESLIQSEVLLQQYRDKLLKKAVQNPKYYFCEQNFRKQTKSNSTSNPLPHAKELAGA